MRPSADLRWRLAVGLVLLTAGVAVAGIGLAELVCVRRALPGTLAPGPASMATEPIVPPPPTATTEGIGQRLTPAWLPSPPRAPVESTSGPLGPGLYTLTQRLGVGAAMFRASEELADRLGFGWYVDWAAGSDRFRSTTVDYVPMIRLRGSSIHPSGEALAAAVAANPGALWLIGNEPDVRWQDNVPADVYAQLYHEAHGLLKDLDPSCAVAIGGVSQPTPLRLRYLEMILEAYRVRYGEPMPVDVWNVHNFILREEQDGWGVDIPPGMVERAGCLREIADHGDVQIFEQQIRDMRQWMKKQGEQDKPLIISEFGILMPEDYGFAPEQVERFMLDTFEFLQTALDPDTGYPADGNRLVQRWCWFSVADTTYPTGNLIWPESSELTPLGRAFSAYARSRP